MKDREIEEQQEKHHTEIKIYKQKVKHLLFEYQNNLSRVQADSEKTLDVAQEEQYQSVDVYKKQIRSLKVELKELELSHQEVIKSLKVKNEQEVSKHRQDFDRRCKELYNKYAAKTKLLREELELRRRNDIHELEERKNTQINALMKSHEKSFAEIKNYYNDITLNNIALINSLKEQVEEMKKKEDRNERLMTEISSENKRLKEPLEAAIAEGEHLKKQLTNYEKDKMALRNSKARLKVLEESTKQLSWEKEILEQRFAEVQKERDELYKEFTDKCKEIEQRVGLKNAILEKKLTSLKSNLEYKDIQLRDLVAALSQGAAGANGSGAPAVDPMNPTGSLDAKAIQEISQRAAQSLSKRAATIDELRFELQRVTRLYNDLLKFCESRLGGSPEDKYVPDAETASADSIPKNLVEAKKKGLDLSGNLADLGFSPQVLPDAAIVGNDS